MNKLLLGLLAFALVSQSCIKAAPTTTQAVATSSQGSASTTKFPSPRTDKTVTTTEAPLTTSDAPATTTKAPPTTSDAPASTTKAQETTTDLPATTTKAPATTTDVPATSTAASTMQPTEPATTTEKVDTTTQKTYDCSSGDGKYPSPYDCAEFYECFSGIAHIFHCPANLWYDPKVETCNWQNMVDCEIN